MSNYGRHRRKTLYARKKQKHIPDFCQTPSHGLRHRNRNKSEWFSNQWHAYRKTLYARKKQKHIPDFCQTPSHGLRHRNRNKSGWSHGCLSLSVLSMTWVRGLCDAQVSTLASHGTYLGSNPVGGRILTRPPLADLHRASIIAWVVIAKDCHPLLVISMFDRFLKLGWDKRFIV